MEVHVPPQVQLSIVSHGTHPFFRLIQRYA